MRYIPENNMFGILEALSKAIERGESLSSDEVLYIGMVEETVDIAINQIEFIRTHLQSQEMNR